TISSSISPAAICFSASDTKPGRAEKHVTSREIWWLSASSVPVGNPGCPSPLQYTVSPAGPASRSAVISVDGYRWDTPNPDSAMEAPLGMSATASVAVITLLTPCLLPWAVPGWSIGAGKADGIRRSGESAGDPLGDDRRDLGVVLLQHHRVAV